MLAECGSCEFAGRVSKGKFKCTAGTKVPSWCPVPRMFDKAVRERIGKLKADMRI